jgi:hypothetical protein
VRQAQKHGEAEAKPPKKMAPSIRKRASKSTKQESG